MSATYQFRQSGTLDAPGVPIRIFVPGEQSPDHAAPLLRAAVELSAQSGAPLAESFIRAVPSAVLSVVDDTRTRATWRYSVTDDILHIKHRPIDREEWASVFYGALANFLNTYPLK